MHDLRDIISSIGIAHSKDMLPWTIDRMSHICYFCHALALNEQQVKFLPEYAHGGKSNPPVEAEDHLLLPDPHTKRTTGNSDFTIPSNEPSDSVPHINNEAVNDHLRAKDEANEKATSHKRSLVCRDALRYVSAYMSSFCWWNTIGNIFIFRGGGNIDNPKMDSSRPPLRWIVLEVGALSLHMYHWCHSGGPWSSFSLINWHTQDERKERKLLTSKSPQIG